MKNVVDKRENLSDDEKDEEEKESRLIKAKRREQIKYVKSQEIVEEKIGREDNEKRAKVKKAKTTTGIKHTG